MSALPNRHFIIAEIDRRAAPTDEYEEYARKIAKQSKEAGIEKITPPSFGEYIRQTYESSDKGPAIVYDGSLSDFDCYESLIETRVRQTLEWADKETAFVAFRILKGENDHVTTSNIMKVIGMEGFDESHMTIFVWGETYPMR